MRRVHRDVQHLPSTKRRSDRLLLSLTVAVIAATIVGCGKGRADRGGLHPAEGQVLWNKQPLAGALVVFYPKEQADAKAIPSRSQAGPDGRFRVGTFDTADGIPKGEYAVTVMQYPLQKQRDGWTSGPNVLPAKYASPKTTDLHVQIAEGDNRLPIIVLASPIDNANAGQLVLQ